jgi:glycosyltransferase involved in cell wall biosynthesis
MEKKDKNLVSIITPSYNQGRFIEDTLLSVKNQDYPNIEHIVVDGGSTDKTLEILRKYENQYDLKWISESDEGQSDAVNKGFRMAKGEIIGWVNSDDGYFDVSAISSVVKFFDKYDDADVIYGDVVRIDENNLILFIIKNRKFNYNYLKKTCSIWQPGAFFRQIIIDKFELDTSLDIAMDYDFWLRIGKKHRFQYINKIVAVDRIHKKRKIVERKDEMIKESVYLSKEYGQVNRSLLYRLFNIGLYGPRSLYMLIEVQRLYYEYNFAFDMKLDNMLSTIFRQIKP